MQRYAWTEAQGGAQRRAAAGPARPPRSGQWPAGPKRVPRGAQAGVWARGCDPRPPERAKAALLLARPLVRAQQQAVPGTGGPGSRRWGVPEAACRPHSPSPATPAGARAGRSARPERSALRHGPGRGWRGAGPARGGPPPLTTPRPSATAAPPAGRQPASPAIPRASAAAARTPQSPNPAPASPAPATRSNTSDASPPETTEPHYTASPSSPSLPQSGGGHEWRFGLERFAFEGIPFSIAP